MAKDLTMEELKEKVSVGDNSIFKSLLYFSSTIQGTRQYFRRQSDLAVSMVRWLDIQSEGKEIFNLFLTFSFPDLHIPELHRLLPNLEDWVIRVQVQISNEPVRI